MFIEFRCGYCKRLTDRPKTDGGTGWRAVSTTKRRTRIFETVWELDCPHCRLPTRYPPLGPCPECAGLLERRETPAQWTNGATWMCNHCGAQLFDPNARKPVTNEGGHALSRLVAEIDKFKARGVSYPELQRHIENLYVGAELLRPKNLRKWLAVAICAGFIVCREGRYFRTSEAEQESERQ